mmetsp:Transcript_112255/g.298349  ORF Transcript_112255/g.298349 Transcript_112255/m.298349 type:complete len:201 (-) Transcript_112255:530-1132(-)
MSAYTFGSFRSAQFMSHILPSGLGSGTRSMHFCPPMTLLIKPCGVISHFWSVLVLHGNRTKRVPAASLTLVSHGSPDTVMHLYWSFLSLPMFIMKPPGFTLQSPFTFTLLSSQALISRREPAATPGMPLTLRHLPVWRFLKKPSGERFQTMVAAAASSSAPHLPSIIVGRSSLPCSGFKFMQRPLSLFTRAPEVSSSQCW